MNLVSYISEVGSEMFYSTKSEYYSTSGGYTAQDAQVAISLLAPFKRLVIEKPIS